MRLETTMVPAPVGASCRPHSSSGWRVAASGALILSSVVVGVSVEADEGGRLQPGQTVCVDTRANEGDIVAANSTIIAPAGSGYATVHRRGVNWQASSNNNFPANQTIPNLTLTEAGVDGEICVTSSATTHVVLDVAGSFPKSVFNPESPNGAVRLLDTRAGTATVPPVEPSNGGGSIQLVSQDGLHPIALADLSISCLTTNSFLGGTVRLPDRFTRIIHVQVAGLSATSNVFSMLLDANVVGIAEGDPILNGGFSGIDGQGVGHIYLNKLYEPIRYPDPSVRRSKSVVVSGLLTLEHYTGDLTAPVDSRISVTVVRIQAITCAEDIK